MVRRTNCTKFGCNLKKNARGQINLGK